MLKKTDVLQKEYKFQRHRAICVFRNNSEGLIMFGSNDSLVTSNYAQVFTELYEDQTEEIKEIHLQRWQGIDDCGNWVFVKKLKVPDTVYLPIMKRKIMDADKIISV